MLSFMGSDFQRAGPGSRRCCRPDPGPNSSHPGLVCQERPKEGLTAEAMEVGSRLGLRKGVRNRFLPPQERVSGPEAVGMAVPGRSGRLNRPRSAKERLCGRRAVRSAQTKFRPPSATERVSARRAVRSVLCVQAQRPIESAAEREGASVGPEGPTERYDQSIRRRVPERVSARRAVRSAQTKSDRPKRCPPTAAPSA